MNFFAEVNLPDDVLSVSQASEELEDLQNRYKNLKQKGFKDTKHIRMSSIEHHLNESAKMITAGEIPGWHLMSATQLIGSAETKLLNSVQRFDPETGQITDTVPDSTAQMGQDKGNGLQMSNTDKALLIGGGSVLLLALLLAVRS